MFAPTIWVPDSVTVFHIYGSPAHPHYGEIIAMFAPHTATANLSFSLTENLDPEICVEAQLRALCDKLGIECNARLLESLTRSDLGQRIEELALRSENGVFECDPWSS